MALIDWTKSDNLRMPRSASARQKSQSAHPAIEALLRGKKSTEETRYSGSKITNGDHMTLLKKHPKLFG